MAKKTVPLYKIGPGNKLVKTGRRVPWPETADLPVVELSGKGLAKARVLKKKPRKVGTKTRTSAAKGPKPRA